MNNFKYYAISWVVLLAAFNAIVFACAGGALTTAFWIGYIFITLAFIGQLICAFFALKAENLSKKFYNIPIVTESYAGMILMIVFGGLFMAISALPTWLGIVICVVILVLSAITVMKASAASDMIEAIDIKVADETAFMKNLTNEANSLISQAKSEEVKAECVKVFEAVRYSPKRSSSMSELDEEITNKFEAFRTAVANDDKSALSDLSSSLINSINKRK